MKMQKNNAVQQDNSSRYYDFWLEQGDRYMLVGNYTQAQHCYEEAASLGADEPRFYVRLGTLALEKQQLEDAEIAFKVAIRLDKDCTEGYCGLGLVYQEMDDFTRAFEMYSKSLELDINNLAALSGLFQASIQLRSFSRIRHYLEVYLKSHAGDEKVMFCLATLYMKDGQLNRALEVLSEILALEPTYTDAVNLLEEAEHRLSKCG